MLKHSLIIAIGIIGVTANSRFLLNCFNNSKKLLLKIRDFVVYDLSNVLVDSVC